MEELAQVQEGDVLVAKMTSPDYVAAMRKASAVVTDQGEILFLKHTRA